MGREIRGWEGEGRKGGCILYIFIPQGKYEDVGEGNIHKCSLYRDYIHFHFLYQLVNQLLPPLPLPLLSTA